jgi:hypothetical protein
LNAAVNGILPRDGYRIEKIRYESTPGVLVVAHLYLPTGTGPWPVILRPHGHWEYKESSPVVQAGAIGLALSGFACFVVEAPGMHGDDNEMNERREMGPHEDWFLSMGAPIQGRYVWDLIRGLDYLATRSDIDASRVGITGEGTGGGVAMYAFAVEERITAAVPVAAASSLEVNPHLACHCNHVPAIVSLGDRADILGLRAQDGALMVLAVQDDPEAPLPGHVRTDEKLKRLFRSQREGKYRFETFHGGYDYNRRMREAALAFFAQHLLSAPPAPYHPEPRPLTDGYLNPCPAGTEPATNPLFLVTRPEDRQTRTFRDLLNEALAGAAPEPYRVDQRLAPWRKYGTMDEIRPGAILAFHDATIAEPKEPGSIPLPTDDIDQNLCILLGMSVAEVLAQLLHTFTPGGPEGWESLSSGLGGDAFTSMIASVKTLITTPEAPAKMVVAEGPVSSLVARFLARYRPSLKIQATHLWTSWHEALDQGIRQNAQPNAQYLEWI